MQSVLPGTEVCPVLPRVIPDSRQAEVEQQLRQVKGLGVATVLCGNAGHVFFVKKAGLRVRGDFGLNVFSSAAMHYWQEEGLLSATASFEATLPQIRDLSKAVDCELLAYGRLPLMLTENCIIKNRTGVCACQSGVTKLIDRKGEEFPVLPDPGTCRSVIYNGKKLYMLDKQQELSKLGLWALRLQFTTENPRDVDRVLGQYRAAAEFDGATCTRGLYLRGVE
jgi:putative protease